jgi:16S rRNA (guanine1207-N2)-methyltransferase
VTAAIAGVYGKPPADVVDTPPNALQFSPLRPGAAALEQQDEASLASMTMLAPPGTLERRYAMALALRAIAPGGAFTVLAPKDRGGNRLRKELEAFGCTVEETARRHHRIAVAARPATIAHIDESLAGVFSWDRIDPGTALLLQHLPPFTGRGADFGCGLGLLANAVLQSAKVTQLTLIDIDRRAVQCAQHNIADPRAQFRWTDARDADPDLSALDFVVMNAPFHDAGTEDKALALSFVKRAAEVLRKDGVCWLVANRHLPYEAILQPLFKRVTLKLETGGYKIYEATK